MEHLSEQEGEWDEFRVTSRNVRGVFVLGGLLMFFLFSFFLLMFSAEPWYYKLLFSTTLLPVLLLSWLLESCGFASGKHQCVLSARGFSYFSPLSSFDRWLEGKLGATPHIEQFSVSWDQIDRIDCRNKVPERRKDNPHTPSYPTMSIYHFGGELFELYGSMSFLYEENLKLVHQELKKRAGEKGIPFETELDDEENWKEIPADTI